MPVHVLDRAQPPTWRATILEKEIIARIKHNLEQSRPQQKILLINTTWLHENQSYKLANLCWHHGFDQVYMMTMTDPASSKLDQLLDFDWRDLPRLGYSSQLEYAFDFWGMCCARNFRHYQEHELLPQSAEFVFVSYNRKPHQHRKFLVEGLLAHGLDQHGVVSFGGDGRSRDTSRQAYFSYGDSEIHDDINIPGDIYSLGQDRIWQNHVINVISETVFDIGPGVFLTEKTWKPILGLRPFLFNGSGWTLDRLEAWGFDPLRDIWPCPHPGHDVSYQQIFDYIKANLDWAIGLSSSELLSWYHSVLPRLQHNRRHFDQHAQQQHATVDSLLLDR